MLFTGAAMSITAFPMLARIIFERGLAGTSLGALALAAGSINDAAAWCLLAIVLASFGNDASVALLAIGGGIVYGAVVLLLVRPMLARFLGSINRQGTSMSGAVFGVILMVLMLGAWFTDYVGIYSVFGAFIMGIAMPRGVVTRALHWFIEPLTVNLLLPLFFVYSGLNTQLSLVLSPALLGVTVVVILAASLGKGVACWAAARLSGESQSESMAIGSLMNARGLMELILLNIGLERGVITPVFFTIMVLMTIVTTLVATPMFERVYGRHLRSQPYTPEPIPSAPGP
jgi:Kef-type K+ transport system membrane component KefB